MAKWKKVPFPIFANKTLQIHFHKCIFLSFFFSLSFFPVTGLIIGWVRRKGRKGGMRICCRDPPLCTARLHSKPTQRASLLWITRTEKGIISPSQRASILLAVICPMAFFFAVLIGFCQMQKYNNSGGGQPSETSCSLRITISCLIHQVYAHKNLAGKLSLEAFRKFDFSQLLHSYNTTSLEFSEVKWGYMSLAVS